MRDSNPVYGSGYAFPPLPTLTGGFPVVAGADTVDQALRTLLLTEPGERIGRPQYGVGLRQYLFQPNTLSTRTQLGETIRAAVERFEPRLILDDVRVEASPDLPERIDIGLRYRLMDPAIRDPRNLVFPFYLDGRSP